MFTILLLDSRHRQIDCLGIFRDTIDGASVHPSRVAEPSPADELITRRLPEARGLSAAAFRFAPIDVFPATGSASAH
ncbi:MAG: hypothetical protein NDI84_09330 [Steroidobacteraceae bacterium]|nr:hypothetical protein [Steroidobacteraceae bacterium]